MISDHLKTELRRHWCVLFLDGRNEHGSHVLPMPGSRMFDTAGMERMLPEIAEQIISEAEALGHSIGDCVVTTWAWKPTNEDGPGFWAYGSVHADLTEIMCGTPHEQAMERERAEADCGPMGPLANTQVAAEY